MEKLNELKFFTQIENGKCIVPSTHLLAVIYGLKKVTRLQFSDKKSINRLKEYIKGYSLKSCVADKDDMINYLDTIYISRNKKLALQAMKCDHNFVPDKRIGIKDIKTKKYFGELLSYPECCVDYALSARNINNSSLNKIPEKISFLSNNLLYSVTNHFLTSHHCCSYSCKKSFAFQKKLYKIISDNNPLFAKELRKYLSRPFLIFLKPEPNIINNAWDNRSGVVFNGIFKKNELIYNESIYYRTSYSKAYYDNREELKIAKYIEKGNKIITRSGILKVYRNNKLIYRLKDNKKVLMYWFNFV